MQEVNGNRSDNNRSITWYLLPVFFGIIGALIAYFAIRKDDPIKAKNCLIIGIIPSAVYPVLGIAITLIGTTIFRP